MKIGRLLATFTGLLFVIPLVAVAIFLITFDAATYKAEVARILSEQTGRKIELNGDVSLSLSAGGLGIGVQKVRVGNAPWASKPDMLEADEIAVTVALEPLLQQRLNIQRIEIVKAKINLETNARGVGNWAIALKEQKPAASAKEANAKENASDTNNNPVMRAPQLHISYAVQHVGVRDSTVRYVQGHKKSEPVDLVINQLAARAAEKTNLSADGRLNGETFQLTLNGGAFADLLSGADWPLDLQARYKGLAFEAEGALKEKGQLIALDTYGLELPQAKATGTMAVRTGGARPSLKGSVTIGTFDATVSGAENDAAKNAGIENAAAENLAADVAGHSSAPAASSGAASPRLFSDAPLDLSAFKQLDADLDLNIDNIKTASGVGLSAIATQARLNGGVLQLQPLSFRLAEQPLTGSLTLNGAGTPSLQLRLNGKDIDTNALLAAFKADKLAVGKSQWMIDVSGQGLSLRAIAASLNGRMALDVDRGPPASATRQSLGGLLAGFAPGFGLLAQADFSCMATRLQAQNGIVTSQGFILDTNLASVAGTGRINLGDETIAMLFKPQVKDAKADMLSFPVKVDGSLLKPRTSIDQRNVAQKLAGTLFGDAVPGLGNNDMPVPVVPPTTDASNGCVQALLNPVYATPPKQEGVLGKQTEQLKEKTKVIVDETKKKVGEEIEKALGSEQGQQLKDSLEKGLGIKLFGQ